LAEYRVVSSLFVCENIRVEGWRVRLRQLYTDAIGDTADGDSTHREGVPGYPKSEAAHSKKSLGSQTLVKPLLVPRLQQLGECWASWFKEAQMPVKTQLHEIYQQMQAEEPSYSAIARQLNQLLLEESAKLPWHYQVAGATDSGPRRQQNEDTCYPTLSDLLAESASQDPLIHHLSIVCDGIGGHEGGEVASSLAVQCIKLQVQAILNEVQEDTSLMMPDTVGEQLAAIIRVANNLIAAQNDAQKREARQRMGTTLVMALHLPQQVKTPTGFGHTHEVYIAHVGDSRAYWLTPHSCQQLTVDDDVATREVRTGRSLYQPALARLDAGALTQALGTRDADLLRPTVQRFIIEEDGVLLLCSDGLSDNNLVEQSWAEVAEPILTGQMSLESAVQFLINRANQKNGHDNTSVVLSYYHVSSEAPALLNGGETADTSTAPELSLETLLPPANNGVASSEPLTPPQEPQPPEAPKNAVAAAVPMTPEHKVSAAPLLQSPKTQNLLVALGLLGLLMLGGIVGLTVWFLVNPDGVEMLRGRAPSPKQSPVTPVTPTDSRLPIQKQNSQ
jgi:serine/threonine protein phosphatase PrpC